MRILTVHYERPTELLAAYDPDIAGGALFYPTRMPLRRNESVVLDIRLPTIPTPALARGRVAQIELGDPGGAWITFEKGDFPTRDYLLAIAEGKAGFREDVRRKSRYPIEIQIDWRIGESDDYYISSTGDLAWDGVLVRTLSVPPLGTEVVVMLRVAGNATLTLAGMVARTLSNGGAGMAIHFGKETEGRRQLRRLLRAMELCGELSFQN